MTIRTIEYLLDRFGPGDSPRSTDYIDLIDTLADDRNAIYFSTIEPTDTAANPLWFNTSTNTLSIYNSGWIEIKSGDLSTIGATSPLSFNSETSTFSIDLSSYYTVSETDLAISDAISQIPATDLTGYATESYVTNAVSGLVDSAPETLNTLNELAAALADDPNFATTITNELANKAGIGHNHDISDVTNLQTELNTKASTGKAIAMALVFGG